MTCRANGINCRDARGTDLRGHKCPEARTVSRISKEDRAWEFVSETGTYELAIRPGLRDMPVWGASQ
jgi:hypothetical protein